MTAERSPMPDAPSSDQPEAHLRALVLCDLVDSTALVERLGDQTATELIRRHDRMARSVMERHDGHEIDKTDGFLVLFERPTHAVAFALDYQRELRVLADETKQPLNARVGIHFGEVVVWNNSPAEIAKGAKPVEVEGLAKPVASRLMGLALPGQILVSGVAQTLVGRGEREAGALPSTVRWLMHGRYHLKGIAEPIAVFEVGEPGIAPMRPPPASAKASPATPFWRRPISVGAAALVLLVVGAVSVYMWMHSEPALAFKERDWVVIGDFVNINADKSFDSTLGVAFRIGIEESRFVNVVPDLAIRQALARMQRSAATSIDREVASEIALREQARAVILPSIAQYGPKLRLVAELIDPNGARTVSTQTADADGPADILPAMDRLLRGTRGRLGESLQQIQATSQPLDRVTTPNFEALRALSRALAMERDGDFDQSERLLKHAIQLDPSFATAYARLGSVLLQQERYPEARAVLDKALTIEERLTERERLFIHAVIAEFEDPQSALSQWRMFASLYPDSGTGQNNAGNIYYTVMHDYDAAESELRKANVVRNPLLNYTLQMLGHLLVAEEKFEGAEQQFRAALAFSPAPILFGLSDALVAGGRLDEAERYLNETSRQPADAEVERAMRRATLLIARRQVRAATAAIEDGLSLAARLPSPNAKWRAQAAMIALRVAQDDIATARVLAAHQIAELSAADRTDADLLVAEELLYAAGWAARLDLLKDAREALATGTRERALDRFPVRARLAALAQAEIDMHLGHAAAVAARLQSSGGGNNLWEVHEVRARALRALGDANGEAAELRWLTSHRGLAHAQWTDQLLGQQARALALIQAESRLATLSPRVETK